MQIKIFAPHWGSNELAPQTFIDKVRAAGFDGIEMSLPLDAAARADWTRRIADAGLALIAQQWETVFHPQFDAHKTALAELLHNACAARPLLVNTHTGKDFYSQTQNLELIALADAISQEHGVPIVHEIHRSRFSGHPMLLLPYLERLPRLPDGRPVALVLRLRVAAGRPAAHAGCHAAARAPHPRPRGPCARAAGGGLPRAGSGGGAARASAMVGPHRDAAPRRRRRAADHDANSARRPICKPCPTPATDRGPVAAERGHAAAAARALRLNVRRNALFFAVPHRHGQRQHQRHRGALAWLGLDGDGPVQHAGDDVVDDIHAQP